MVSSHSGDDDARDYSGVASMSAPGREGPSGNGDATDDHGRATDDGKGPGCPVDGEHDRMARVSRRGFVASFAAAVGTAVAACGSSSSPRTATPNRDALGRAIPPPATGPLIKDQFFDLGPVSSLPADTWVTRTIELPLTPGEPAQLGHLTVFVRRPAAGQQRIMGPVEVLSSACSHLGCPVRWVSAADQFICPCHGAVFNARGVPTGGPARRPLSHARNVVRGGRLFSQPPPPDFRLRGRQERP